MQNKKTKVEEHRKAIVQMMDYCRARGVQEPRVDRPRNAWGILTEQAQMRPLNGCKEQRTRGETRFDPSGEEAGAEMRVSKSFIRTGSR